MSGMFVILPTRSMTLYQLTAFVTDCLCIARAISRGKPFPDPYLEGVKRCGVDPRKTLVVEDAPSGIRSGKACGAKTLAVLTSHDKARMVGSGAGPDYTVDNLFAWVVRSNLACHRPLITH